MTTVSSLPARSQPARRQHRPLLPVNVRATLTGSATPADLPDELVRGAAILSIISGDETDPDTRLYWIKFLFDICRQPYAVELLRFDPGHERYVITLEDERCSCPDAVYRSDRPGSCKHVRALKIVLPPVANPVTAAATSTEGTVAA